MKQWIISNPSKSRSKSLWRKFITSWLTKANDTNINKAAYSKPTVDRTQRDRNGNPLTLEYENLF
jgi:hypothetical protein